MNKREIGAFYEAEASKYLEALSWRHVASNFCTRGGEIDRIYLTPDNVLVFVEVRFRRSASYGQSEYTISRTKLRRMLHAARSFLQRYPVYQAYPCRMDAVCITGQRMEHYEDIGNRFA